MFLDFEKWHGCRNDFIVLWISDHDGELVLGNLKRQASRLCDRRSGIGADGLLVLQTKSRQELTPHKLTIINSDGSLAGNCGNGLRCAALSVRKKHRELGNPKELPDTVALVVEGDLKVCRFLQHGGDQPFVVVDMGVPIVGNKVPWHDAALKTVKAAAADIGIPELASEIGTCTIGNPHIVLTSESASREAMLKLGPVLQKSPAWDGMNVHLIRTREIQDKDQARAGRELGGKLSELFEAFVWERGAGETEACGSGVCAIAATAIATGLVDRDGWIGVDLPGGRLFARWPEGDEQAQLAGPASFVFQGKTEL